ncbi:MAG: hypothetical protein A2Y10_18480 [Planctomycetes bacterium GWF2_41_51]|nr:MAG: hypothetical protein A2Y10_18480 [Planctomycetes bacterium GWF2_41_51]HBG26680.1 hypothetical protein [Phycisphaerales bacterium]
MIGFHIDMNIGQFTAAYLEKWLKEFAALGYDAIIWEVENNIQWQTCPECASPDAFTKNEFKDILKLCKSLGMESIPLLQTLGHCEYVLKNSKYKYLAELPDKIDQYCPLHPQLTDFLHQWIDEYLDLFGPVRKFHIGADEASNLGQCPRCNEFVQNHSLSSLYAQHINNVSQYLINRNIQPIAWADMILKHPEEINKLSKKIIIADWMYDIYRGSGKVWVWGKGLQTNEQLDDKTLDTFGRFLFPDGDEPGKEPETFYTADFLAANGFATITCPSSSCYGDNVFAPRAYYHMKNIYDSIRKGCDDGISGSILTSWTIRLFPWELQRMCIEMAPAIATNTAVTLEELEQMFLKKHFGVTDKSFFKACGSLSKSCLFSYNGSLGFDKDAEPVSPEHIDKTIKKLINDNLLEKELDNCLKRLNEYEQGLNLLNDFMNVAKKGHEQIQYWQLAARNLINRAQAAICLLKNANQPTDADLQKIPSVLDALRQLKIETRNMYEPTIKSSRLNDFLHWIYDAVEKDLYNGLKKLRS